MICIHGIELVCKGKITSQGTRRLNIQLNTPTNTDLVLKSHPAKEIGHYPCSLLCQETIPFGRLWIRLGEGGKHCMFTCFVG